MPCDCRIDQHFGYFFFDPCATHEAERDLTNARGPTIMGTMRNTLTPNQARVDQVFSALSDALPDVDFTVYDVEGHAYILDFDDDTSLLLQAEGYSPLSDEMELIAIGDEDR